MSKVTAVLDLNAQPFMNGMSQAERSMGRFASRMTGMSGGFGAFNQLTSAFGFGAEQGNSFREIVTQTALVAGSMFILKKAVDGVTEEFRKTQELFSKSGTKMNPLGWAGSAALQTGRFFATGALGGALTASVFGETPGQKKINDTFNKWTEWVVGKTTKVTDQKKWDEFKGLGGMGRPVSQIDSFARIGLGTGYLSGADYSRQTADNTSKLVELITQMTNGTGVFAPLAKPVMAQ